MVVVCVCRFRGGVCGLVLGVRLRCVCVLRACSGSRTVCGDGGGLSLVGVDGSGGVVVSVGSLVSRVLPAGALAGE